VHPVKEIVAIIVSPFAKHVASLFVSKTTAKPNAVKIAHFSYVEIVSPLEIIVRTITKNNSLRKKFYNKNNRIIIRFSFVWVAFLFLLLLVSLPNQIICEHDI